MKYSEEEYKRLDNKFRNLTALHSEYEEVFLAYMLMIERAKAIDIYIHPSKSDYVTIVMPAELLELAMKESKGFSDALKRGSVEKGF